MAKEIQPGDAGIVAEEVHGSRFQDPEQAVIMAELTKKTRALLSGLRSDAESKPYKQFGRFGIKEIENVEQ